MGQILALDLGQRCGFAVGAPVRSLDEERPRSGSVALKKQREARSIALSNFIIFLQAKLSTEEPVLVVKEAPLALQAFKVVRSSEDNVRMTYGLHAITEAMCVRFGIRLEEAAPATIRKRFIGKANMGARKETKAAVIQRCHVLRLMPRDCFDEDRADAVATWDWAAATFGRAQYGAKELHMFGEKA